MASNPLGRVLEQLEVGEEEVFVLEYLQALGFDELTSQRITLRMLLETFMATPQEIRLAAQSDDCELPILPFFES